MPELFGPPYDRLCALNKKNVCDIVIKFALYCRPLGKTFKLKKNEHIY